VIPFQSVPPPHSVYLLGSSTNNGARRLLLDQIRQKRLHTINHPPQIRIQNLVIISSQGRLLQPLPRKRGTRRTRPSIEHQHSNLLSRKLRVDFLLERLERRELRDIRLDGETLDVGEFRGDGLGCGGEVCGEVGEDNMETLGGEGSGCGEADARCGARDDSHAACLECCVHLVLRG